MIRDEYNKVEITNDKQLLRTEFGKTQKVEFSSQKENTIPEGDLNEKYVGKTIKKVTEVNVDYIQKIPTHTTATVVTSSATAASGAAAAAASTVVAASSVAVVAIATVTGITVGLHDYRCELTSLLISSNEISYSFTVVDEKRDDGQNYQSYYDAAEPRYQINNRTAAATDPSSDNPTSEEPTSEEPVEEEPTSDISDSDDIFNNKRPFVLRVSNGSYESEHYLGYGSSGKNTFYGLTLGDTYSIVLSENRSGGEILYNESFTTVENSYVRDVYVSGAANFRQGTFDVYLDYIDELEVLSDFVLTLTEKDNALNSYAFPLENMSGNQEASIYSLDQADVSFDFEKEYTYSLSYQNKEDVLQFGGGTVTFYNTVTDISEVFGVTWDKKANFLNNQTTITLNYQDDFDIFSNFRFVLMQEEPVTADSNELVYSLQKTTEPQTVTLTSNQMFSYSYTYSYMFVYDEQGKDVEQIIESDSGLTFEDNSGTAVNGVSWDKTINLVTKQFTVTLDYVDDDSYNRFSDFQLALEDEDMPEERYDEPYDLVKTTEPQTVTIIEDTNLRLRKPMLYSFTYYDKLDESTHILEQGTVTFTDTSNGQKQFNGITINPTPDMSNNTIEVQLDYVDEFEELYGFTLNLYVGEETPRSIYLSDTPDKQNVDVSNYNIDFTKTYNYFVTYYDDATDGEEISPDVGKGTITFDHSVFNGLTVNKEANYDTKEFTVQLDFVDDFNYYSDFVLVMSDDYDNEKTFNLTKTTDVQTLALDDKEHHEEDGDEWDTDVFTLRASTFTYTFSYYDASISDYVSEQSDPFHFENSLTSTFTNVVSPFDFTAEDGGQSYLIPLRFDFNDAGQVYEGFDVQIFKGEESVGSLRFEGDTKTKDWLLGVFVPDGTDINDIIGANDTSIRVFTYIDEDSNPYFDDSEFEDPIFTKNVTFTLGEDHQIYGGRITYDHIMYNMDLGFQLIYSGLPEDYTDCELVLESLESGNIYRFSISELSPAMNYTTIYMDSDIIGDAISETDFQEDFIAHEMKVSVTYYTSNNEGPFTTVLHDLFQFYESN